MAGAPVGNTNATKGKPLTDALRRALARAGEGDLSVGMNGVADKVVEAALAGEQWAIREIWDRLEGKPAQSVTVGGDEDNPIQARIIVEYVKAAGGVPVPAPSQG